MSLGPLVPGLRRTVTGQQIKPESRKKIEKFENEVKKTLSTLKKDTFSRELYKTPLADRLKTYSDLSKNLRKYRSKLENKLKTLNPKNIKYSEDKKYIEGQQKSLKAMMREVDDGIQDTKTADRLGKRLSALRQVARDETISINDKISSFNKTLLDIRQPLLAFKNTHGSLPPPLQNLLRSSAKKILGTLQKHLSNLVKKKPISKVNKQVKDAESFYHDFKLFGSLIGQLNRHNEFGADKKVKIRITPDMAKQVRQQNKRFIRKAEKKLSKLEKNLLTLTKRSLPQKTKSLVKFKEEIKEQKSILRNLPHSKRSDKAYFKQKNRLKTLEKKFNKSVQDSAARWLGRKFNDLEEIAYNPEMSISNKVAQFNQTLLAVRKILVNYGRRGYKDPIPTMAFREILRSATNKIMNELWEYLSLRVKKKRISRVNKNVKSDVFFHHDFEVFGRLIKQLNDHKEFGVGKRIVLGITEKMAKVVQDQNKQLTETNYFFKQNPKLNQLDKKLKETYEEANNEGLFVSLRKGNLVEKLVPKTQVQLLDEYKAVKSRISHLRESEKKAGIDFQNKFEKLRKESIKYLLAGDHNAINFQGMDILLRKFYNAQVKDKSTDPTGTMRELYKIALKMVNSIKIPVVIPEFLAWANVKSINELSKNLKIALRNAINPNHDPSTSGRITSVDDLKASSHSEIIIDGKTYKRNANIGEGAGNATIYLSVTDDQEKVASKVFNDSEPNLGAWNAFNEIYVNSLAKGENIVALRGGFISELGNLTLAMVYYAEGNLSQYQVMQKALNKPFSKVDYITVLSKAFAATIHLLRKGIVNQDLKLKNIMIKTKKNKLGKTVIDTISLCDFGSVGVGPNMDHPLGGQKFDRDQGTESFCINKEELENIEKYLSFPLAAIALKILTGINGADLFDTWKPNTGEWNIKIAEAFKEAIEPDGTWKPKAKIADLPDMRGKLQAACETLKKLDNKTRSFIKNQLSTWVIGASKVKQSERLALSEIPPFKKPPNRRPDEDE